MSNLEQSERRVLAGRVHDFVFSERGPRLAAGDFPRNLTAEEAAEWGCLAGAAMAIAYSRDPFLADEDYEALTDEIVPIAFAHRKGVSLERAERSMRLGAHNNLENMHGALLQLLDSDVETV